MRDRRSQVALAAVLFLLGFLVIVQLQAQQAGTGLETRSSQDLTLLIANLNTRNDQLRSEISDLDRRLAMIDAANQRGDTSVGQLRSDLDRVRMWSGLAPASGPGIRVVVAGQVTAGVVSDLLNELRNAGAEAMSIGGVRVVAGTVVAGPPGALSVDNTSLGDRVEVLAIGNPPALTGALTRAGGLVAQVQATQKETSIEVSPLDVVELAATERSLVPALGEPRP